MIRHTVNALFLLAYAARIGQGFHLGLTLTELWPYIGAWMSWVMLCRLRAVQGDWEAK